MSIHEAQEKINPIRDIGSLRALAVSNGVKGFLESNVGKDILVILIIILVGLGSFELGRLSNKSESTGVKITYPEALEGQASSIQALSPIKSNTKTSSSQSGNFFASSKGNKYYSIGCSAGKTIKQENRIYFQTSDQAETAGYSLSTSCK